MCGVLGQFNEEVIVSNVTVSNSEIAIQGIPFFAVLNLTIDGLYITSNVLNGELIFKISL